MKKKNKIAILVTGLGQIYFDYSKKMITTLMREKRKIKRNLEGIRKMSKLPGAVVVIDCRREYLALREARKLGITTIGPIDTNSDPDTVDIAIPGNDDAMRTIELLLRGLADSVEEGKAAKPSEEEQVAARRPSSRRPTTARAAGDGPTKLDNQEEIVTGTSEAPSESQEQS